MSATLDLDRLAKVAALMNGGATEGERNAARSRAEAIAARAGMTLDAALSKLDAKPKQQSSFDFNEAWRKAQANAQRRREQEERDRAQRERDRAEYAARLRERERRNALLRAQVLRRYGSEEALFAATDWEKALAVTIEPLATWDHSLPKRRCETCWQEFQPNHEKSLYCTPLCRSRAQSKKKREATAAARPVLTCEWCNEPFKPGKWNSRFCSEKHQKAASRVRERAAKEAKAANSDHPINKLFDAA